jgi:hypothetical protein
MPPILTDGSDKVKSAPLVTSVEPKNEKSKTPVGDDALNKAVIIVVASWAILFVLMWSLRHHNV